MYKALRSFKIQKPDGTIGIVQPGDPVPGAEKWPTLQHYISQKWVEKDDAPSRPVSVSVNKEEKVSRGRGRPRKIETPVVEENTVDAEPETVEE